ncbi:MAG: hypothetical protein QN144_12190 [Armatimonadota bacterium]|nr:hypothetical protein [Armatimonadota bacterium]
MRDIATLITQLGFPAFVATVLLYWLIRSVNGKLDRLVQSMEATRQAIVDLHASIRYLADKLEGGDVKRRHS